MTLNADENLVFPPLESVIVLGILALSGIVLLPVLFPVAATDNSIKMANSTNSNGTFNNLDELSMGNVAVSPRIDSMINCL